MPSLQMFFFTIFLKAIVVVVAIVQVDAGIGEAVGKIGVQAGGRAAFNAIPAGDDNEENAEQMFGTGESPATRRNRRDTFCQDIGNGQSQCTSIQCDPKYGWCVQCAYEQQQSQQIKLEPQTPPSSSNVIDAADIDASVGIDMKMANGTITAKLSPTIVPPRMRCWWVNVKGKDYAESGAIQQSHIGGSAAAAALLMLLVTTIVSSVLSSI